MPAAAVTFSPEALGIVGLILTSLVGAIVYLHRTTLGLAAERAVAERERAIRAEKVNDQTVPVLEKQSGQIERLNDQIEKLTDLMRTRV